MQVLTISIMLSYSFHFASYHCHRGEFKQIALAEGFLLTQALSSRYCGWLELLHWVGMATDVIVHRLLAAALGLSNLPPQFRDRSTLTSISDSIAPKSLSWVLLESLYLVFAFVLQQQWAGVQVLRFLGGIHFVPSWIVNMSLLSEFVFDWDWFDCPADLNYRHRNAQMAGRASVELHTLIFFKNRYILQNP
jgi:hypothetical protein